MDTVKIPEIYGSLVFNDKVMKERLPKDVYKAVHKAIASGSSWSWMSQTPLRLP